MNYHVALLGQPGASKTTVGLSFPGLEHHIFGSSEELTAINFSKRKDILPIIKPDWMDYFLKDEKTDERAKFFDDNTSEQEMDVIKRACTARMIKRYRRYILQLKEDLKAGKREELKTVFLDNGTPFLDYFRDWMDFYYVQKFVTEKGNYDSIKASIEFSQQASDFLELFNSLECNTVMSFHVTMTVDEENAAKVNFMEDSKKGIRYPKEFNPLVTGNLKYKLAGKFDFAFFLQTEENPGQPNKYIAKLEADASNIGIAKGRLQPFEIGRRIELPNDTFYDFLNAAIAKKYGPDKASN